VSPFYLSSQEVPSGCDKRLRGRDQGHQSSSSSGKVMSVSLVLELGTVLFKLLYYFVNLLSLHRVSGVASTFTLLPCAPCG
jgi:hypothetical protein